MNLVRNFARVRRLSGGLSLLTLLSSGCVGTTPTVPTELARGTVFSVIELTFTGPFQGPRDVPARDVDFSIRLRHESGDLEHTVPGFWDGGGRGGTSGNVFRVRFCPTAPGRWTIVEIKSNSPALAGQHLGEMIVAVPAPAAKGFWLVDPESPGRRWYMRSNGAHDYIVGNTMYSFLSQTYFGGRPNGTDVARDVRGNADYFKKLRFSVPGDLYPDPTVAPFFDEAGQPTYDGDNSHRPNPRWFQERVDVAVRTANQYDMIADLIMGGVDRVESRSTLRAGNNGGDPTPYLRYLVARYGAYSNVWFCLMNEYPIRNPQFTAEQIREIGAKMRSLLVYPNPISVHGRAGRWVEELNTAPPWNDHVIIQRKMKTLPMAADFLRENHPLGGGDKPVVDDELAYQGTGDNFSEEDVVESHLGAFLGGGYGTTGYKASRGRPGEPLPATVSVGAAGLKPGEKLGQYFAGNFNASEHGAADNLKWLRDVIDGQVSFWKMAPGEAIFGNLHPDFRGLAWAGHEYVLGTNQTHEHIVAHLPPGQWTITCYDALTKTARTLATDASGDFSFASPDSRAALFHFKRQ